MKRIKYALLIAVIAAAVCMWQESTVDNACRLLEKDIDSIVFYTENGDFETVQIYVDSLKSVWEEYERKLDYTLSHTVTDEFAEKVFALRSAASNRQADETKLTAAELKFKIKALKKSLKPTGENIL